MGDRERRREELFEDLDRFFGSGPEGGLPAPGGEGPGAEAGPGREGSPAGEAAEEELLPPGWLPDVEGLDEALAGPEPEPGAEPEPTAEMSGEEWARLREAVGEAGGPEGAGPPDWAAGRGGQERDEEPPELTVEDLRRPPPQYADLPGPHDRPGTGPGEGQRVEPPEASPRETAPSEPREAAGAAQRPSGAWERTPPDDAWESPPLEEVEATAERLAREYRTEPGEPEDELLRDLRSPGPRTVRVGGPEAMTGPAWEEPGAVVAPEPSPAWGGRNMTAAVLSAAVLAAAALVSLAAAPAAFAFVAGAVALVGQAELYAALQRRGHQPATALGLVVGGLAMAAAYLRGEATLGFFLGLGLGLSFLWYMVAPPKARDGLVTNVALTIAGIVYVPVLGAFLLMVLARPEAPRALTLTVLGLTFLYDAAAFAVGSLWGERPLAPTISPRKSWEGLVGATVVVFIVAVALVSQVEVGGVELGLARALGLALLVSVFAPLGDLAESAIKRDLGIKDMGAILPGHGGILDRIDSVLFVAPAAYYFLKIFL
ncbi:MAG TPA: phosphatidate cytidylyltransferase [Actinomycetota bacterium]|nr:phosphatidate cytidylyltransferase [Actinomycetota bacterium]